MNGTPQHIELWEKFLAIVADNLPAEQFDAWFKPITSVGFADGALTISVPTPFFVEQIEERYMNLMSAALTRVYGRHTKLYYKYNQIGNRPDTEVSIRATRPSAAAKAKKDARTFDLDGAGEVNQAPVNPCLNPIFTFENYCCGDSNKLARSIGEAIAENPDCNTFNPLFIFGPSGCGKTHLIQAIGIRIKENCPEARVLYVTARLFESQYTSNLNNVNSFLRFYQSIDVLIIDDIQDFIGKIKTQQAFFHIFNHLVQNGKQLILSSDCAPARMEGMEARLLSRFKQGMTAELDRPDLELRRNVLRLKSQQDGLSLPDDVIDFIATHVKDSIREIIGVEVSLVARSTVLNCDIDMALARTVVGCAVKINKREVNFEMVADAVASYYDIDVDQIFSHTRRRDISDPRQIVMYLAKKHTKMSLKSIGMRLNRHHATVLYACRQTEERIPMEKQLKADVKAIEKILLEG